MTNKISPEIFGLKKLRYHGNLLDNKGIYYKILKRIKFIASIIEIVFI